MPGARNLVIFLGLALVVYIYWTGPQRAALSQLWSSSTGTKPSAWDMYGNNQQGQGYSYSPGGSVAGRIIGKTGPGKGHAKTGTGEPLQGA